MSDQTAADSTSREHVIPAGPRAMRRERWIDLPSDGDYAGFKFRVWVNHPTQLMIDVMGDKTEGETDTDVEARRTRALGRMILEHNGWRDEDDKPYPPANEPDRFWAAIPTELAASMMALIRAEVGKLPNSLAPQTRRR